jgi:hypothetical protein
MKERDDAAPLRAAVELIAAICPDLTCCVNGRGKPQLQAWQPRPGGYA